MLLHQKPLTALMEGHQGVPGVTLSGAFAPGRVPHVKLVLGDGPEEAQFSSLVWRAGEQKLDVPQPD